MITLTRGAGYGFVVSAILVGRTFPLLCCKLTPSDGGIFL